MDDTDASDSGMDGADDGMMGPPSFAQDIEPIISSSCVESCHEIGGMAETDIILSMGEAYDNIVGVMSVGLPQMVLINPGDRDTSYMWHKLNNTHMANGLGGKGAQMPFAGQPLPAEQLILIGNWIDDGAMP